MLPSDRPNGPVTEEATMPVADPCPGSDHRAPRTGGSCGCGLVTVVPARRATAQPDVRELLARCLDDAGGLLAVPPGGARGLRQERADRLLAALSEAGLVVAPGPRRQRLTA
jgi:hypothetical protein